jgi:hypothetical protein
MIKVHLSAHAKNYIINSQLGKVDKFLHLIFGLKVNNFFKYSFYLWNFIINFANVS